MLTGNNSHYLVLADGADFSTDSRDGCLWDDVHQRFRLADDQQPRLAKNTVAQTANARDAARPLCLDDYGQLGFLSDNKTQLLYVPSWAEREDPKLVRANSASGEGGSAADVSLDLVDAPSACVFCDLHIGGDGRVALPYSDGDTRQGLLLVHLARRWQRHCLLTDEPLRVWVDHLQRVWIANNVALMLCSGEPLPQAYTASNDRFEPMVINPKPLAQQWRQPLPGGIELLAMCADHEFLYLLVHHGASDRQRLLRRALHDKRETTIEVCQLPESVPPATDIAALAIGRLALLLPAQPDAADLPVVDVKRDGSVQLLARRYPQHSQRQARFVSSTQPGVFYLSEQGPKKLYPLAQARYRHEGKALLNTTLDCGEPGVSWHRIYLDACIPTGCTLRVEAKAFDEFANEGSDWQMQPVPQWQQIGSELAFHENDYAARRDREHTAHRSGLYEILMQRESGVVRELRGRYLKLRLHMTGDGRHTPAIASARIYYPRISWQQAYLPELFHQTENVTSDPGHANGADVRERFLASLEGLLTPVENRIANAECWLYPQGTPATELPKLAAMIGIDLPLHWPLYRQRRWLQAAGELQKHKGTYAGLCLALDIATDGALGKGQIVPVENYRLRRTLSTVLGIHMSDDRHPLTLGTSQSGNSIVGDTLVLTEEDAWEFMALLSPEIAGFLTADKRAQAKAAVTEFFDHYAHQLTLVVHSHARALLPVAEAVLEQFIPAHTVWLARVTDKPFVLGLSPLLGIDTYLEAQPPWRQIVLNDVYLGREGIIRNPAAFAPSDAIPQGDRP